MDAGAPGSFDKPLGHEGAAGEVVGGVLGLLARVAVAAGAVEPLSVSVVEDVLVLVQQGEVLAGLGFTGVKGDDPGLPVPVAHA